MIMNLKAELSLEEIEKILCSYVEQQIPGEYKATAITFHFTEASRDMRGEPMGPRTLSKASVSLTTQECERKKPSMQPLPNF
jgi:hypothetical protein